MFTIGLIVNPIAGMGGRVGLKGTDGPAVQAAIKRGASPLAPARAAEALHELSLAGSTLELLVWRDEMGGHEARAAGFSPVVLAPAVSGPTTAADTHAAAKEMKERGVLLLLFAGGDGTAVDVLRAVGTETTVLGIPAGVKMHSAVFAVNPRSAGRVARAVVERADSPTREAEVADVDEELLRKGIISPRLHGVLRVPAEPNLVQSLKARSAQGEDSALVEIAERVFRGLHDGVLTIIGPGTTTGAILRRIGVEPTLLGVDVLRGRQRVMSDAAEEDLLRLLGETPNARIVIAPVGGQGFLLGRGNQPISPAVVRRVGAGNLLVVATKAKVASLRGRPLLVDTGDSDLDHALCGYVRILAGYRQEIVYRVAA